MIHHPKLLYVLADGARARFVERRPEPRSFATFEEIDAREDLQNLRRELRASPPARSFESGSPGLRHSVGKDDYVRDAKTAFVSTVAERVATLLHDGPYEGVVVAAPAPLLSPLQRQLENAGAKPVAIDRDLTNTPDAALGDWLEAARPSPLA